jgi:hypothetical protein
MNADDSTEALITTWKDAHVDFKIAETGKDLARSAVEHRFKELGVDVVHSKTLGPITRVETKGIVDWEKLAREHLGDGFVDSIAERFRRPSTFGVRAPSQWAAAAGLPA